MSERPRAAENRNYGTSFTDPEDRTAPFGAPFLVLNDVVPVAFVPSLVPDPPSKAAAIGNVLDKRGAVLDAINATRDFCVIPSPSNGLVVIRGIGDAASDRLLRKRAQNGATIAQNDLIGSQ